MFFDTTDPILGIATACASLLFFLGLVMAFWRLVKGPTVFDRIVALDLVGGLCLGLIVLFAIHFDQPVLLDAAFAIAVIGFLGTVAFARFLEGGGGQ